MHRSSTKSGSEGVIIEEMGIILSCYISYLILKSLMFLLCTLHLVLAVEGVPSGHHGNGKIHAWCLIAGGYIRLSVPYYRERKIGLAGGISFPNSLHSHHSDFAEANPSDTDSRYHSPSPKIEYYGLSMSLVFFSA